MYVEKVTTSECKSMVNSYIKKANRSSEIERTSTNDVVLLEDYVGKNANNDPYRLNEDTLITLNYIVPDDDGDDKCFDDVC